MQEWVDDIWVYATNAINHGPCREKGWYKTGTFGTVKTTIVSNEVLIKKSNSEICLLQGISLLSSESQLSFTLITPTQQALQLSLKFPPFSPCKNSTLRDFSLSETWSDAILNRLWSNRAFWGRTFRGRYCLKGLHCSPFSWMKTAAVSLITGPIQNVVCTSPQDPKWF